MWFSDAPPPTGALGTPPLAVVSWRADPDDGAHLWAVAEHPTAEQQIRFAEEFAAMPDVMLQSEGYRLAEVAGVALPSDLSSSLARGPDELSATSHPLSPALITIAGHRLLALRRIFGALRVDAALFDDSWILAVCPLDTPPTSLT